MLNRRLTTGDNHPVEKMPPFFQENHDLLFAHQGSEFIGENKFFVMAVRTTKITSLGKDHAGYFTRKVNERKFLKTAYLHIQYVFLVPNSSFFP